MLTDSVFWLIIYPFLTSADFSLDFVSTTSLLSNLFIFFPLLNYREPNSSIEIDLLIVQVTIKI